MAVGEIVVGFIADIVCRPAFSIVGYVFGSLGYLTGAAFLTIVSLGRLEFAPLDSLFDGRRLGRKWEFTFGIWVNRPGKRRALKAGWVCVAGFLLWGGIGAGVHQAMKGRPQASPPAVSDEIKLQPIILQPLR